MLLHYKDMCNTCICTLKIVSTCWRLLVTFSGRFNAFKNAFCLIGLTQREDWQIVGLILHACVWGAPLYTVIKNAIFKNRSSSIDLYLLPSWPSIETVLDQKQRNNVFLSKLDMLSTLGGVGILTTPLFDIHYSVQILSFHFKIQKEVDIYSCKLFGNYPHNHKHTKDFQKFFP